MLKSWLMGALIGFCVVPAFAHNNLDGSWSLASRICSDGSKTNDAYQAGQDQLKLNFQNDKFSLNVRVTTPKGPCGYLLSGDYFVKWERLFLKTDGVKTSGVCEVGGNVELPIEVFALGLKDSKSLSLTSPEYGVDDTCPRGTSLVMIFNHE